jgi:hypothetical protein
LAIDLARSCDPDPPITKGFNQPGAAADLLPTPSRRMICSRLAKCYADDAIALAADADWEAAIMRYRQHLASQDEKMPSQVMKLSKLCFHDGEILDGKNNNSR